MNDVLYELREEVAIVTINRPEHRNAVNAGVRDGLRQAWQRFEGDQQARVAILTAAGDTAFSAGKDIKEPGGFEASRTTRDYLPILGDNMHVSKPVIAAVNGYALGAGFVFAQMCDICVASTHATFAISEVKLGRGVPWAAPLITMIPQKVLLELLLTSATITAQRAYEIGLVNHVVPAEQLMDKAMALARLIVAGAPLSVRAARQVVGAATEMGRTDALDRSYDIFKPVYESDDAQEGLRAFAEKRLPRWSGRYRQGVPDMHFDLDEDHRLLKDLVARFLREHVIPLEANALAREASTGQLTVLAEDRQRLDQVSKELGLWGLDAPEELGGHALSVTAMVGVNEEFGKTIMPYELAPDSPNLTMLLRAADAFQRDKYLAPYARGETQSAMAISEPGAGTDPSALTTRAQRDGDDWILNGRKIWISRADKADWTIVMAVTDKSKGVKGGISAFIVDKGTPGFVVERRIPMIGGASTFEILLDNVRVPASQLLGKEGYGFGPMQARLSSRRVQIAAWNVGRAQRALDMMCEYATQRKTFGTLLAERQTVQNWVADAAIRIHGCRLMVYEAAARVDRGEEARAQVSMIKVAATEMAWDVIDHAMQLFGGMGMAMEMPLQAMANLARLGRVYEGPNEIHRWVIARELLGLKR